VDALALGCKVLAARLGWASGPAARARQRQTASAPAAAGLTLVLVLDAPEDEA
jgi:hypothetical protein